MCLRLLPLQEATVAAATARGHTLSQINHDDDDDGGDGDDDVDDDCDDDVDDDDDVV